MKIFCVITCLLLFTLSQQVVPAQQPLAQQAFAIFEQRCLDCHGEFGSYSDVLTIKHRDLIENQSVIPGQPDASEFYLRLLGDTDNGSQMPLGQEPLDAEMIATVRRWIESGAPDWEAIPKPERRFITTEAMLKTIHTHVTSLTAFERSFARYFTLTHLYNAGASGDNLRAYRNALSKLVNSLSWGSEVIKPTPIDREETIFYIDLRHYEWDIKSDKWYKIEQAYPYGVQLRLPTYTTLCEETDCELPFVRADWFIATASLPPLYHEILDLPKTDKELETRLEIDVAGNLKNAPGVRVWRAGFNESGVSVNNRIVERHKSRYGAYWKSYDFAGNVGAQNIFTHPLDFTHDGGEIIFNLPNGLQAYYLSTAAIRHQVQKGDTLWGISRKYYASLKSIIQANNIHPTVRLTIGESLLIPGIGGRLDEAPINIVSNAGTRDPVVRNGLSCMGCHTEGMKAFEDQVRSVILQSQNPPYDKAQALRLYAEKSEMDSFIREDTARYREAIEAAGGVFGGSEPIQQLVKQFEGPLDATHAAVEVGLKTDDFLKRIRENSALQNAGLLVLGVEKGTVKRDAWESQFGGIVSTINLDSPLSPVEQLFQFAEALYRQANYEGAIGKYTEALEESTKRGVKTEVIDKDFPTLANYKIAVSYSRLAEQSGDVNHYDTAIEYIEKVAPTATIPKHQEGLTYLWGHILYRTEQFELAEPKFTQLIENFPNSLFVENAWYAIGQLNYKLQNYEDSRQAFKAVLDGFPNSDFKDDAQHLIAQSFLNESNYEQAYQEFDKIATEEFKNYPDLQAEAMYKAAYSLNQLGRDDESIGRYTNFITQFPESQYVTAAYFDQGAIYARQKDYDNARVNYELALQNTADRTLQSEIQSAIGRTYSDQGNLEKESLLLLLEVPEPGVVRPQYKFKVGPKYPEVAAKAGKEGQVILQATIDENGIPRDIVAITDIGFGLEAAAIAALKKTTFHPATKGGNPISLQVEIPYFFTLKTRSNSVYADMVLIPAGEFQMGGNDNDAENDEKPMHTVYIDAFYIDKYEVTNAQYKKFIDANPQWRKDRILRKYHDGDYLKHWNENNYPHGKGDHPIVYVSWYAAMAYAQWEGKRLPIEAEWEKAARGSLISKKYAWGNLLDSDKANYGENIGNTTPVGTFPANGYGLYDMAGNVWEWCLDEYDADFYSVSPRHNPLAGGTVNNIVSDFTSVKSVRVLRGGSWVSNAKFVRVSDRTRFTPKITNKARGFRCVRSVTQ